MKLRHVIISFLLLVVSHAHARSLDLLDGQRTWTSTAQEPALLSIIPSPDAPLAGELSTSGTREDFPRFRLAFPEPQDWRPYHRLHAKVRLTAGDLPIDLKLLNFVFYDERTRIENTDGNPHLQQGIRRSVQPGNWLELELPLESIRRSAIRSLEIYFYSNPPAAPHRCRIEFARLELVGPGREQTYFDGDIYPSTATLFPPASEATRELETRDGLSVSIDAQNRIRSVQLDGKPFAGIDTRSGGLFLRDAAKSDPPQPQLEGIGFSSETTPHPHYIEWKGSIRNLASTDRFVTAYLALPVAGKGLQWSDSISRSEAVHPANELEWVHHRYPLSALTLPDTGGISLAIRMDEPSRYRLSYNPALQIYFAAFDIAVTPEKPEARFSVILYRHDPAWKFRSALQRYYDFFPGFFEKRVTVDGGWGLWREHTPVRTDLAAGYAYSWGPALDPKVLSAHRELGILNLPYIEPEYWQMSLGDFTSAGDSEAMDRLRKTAAGDPDEWKKFSTLRYTANDFSGHYRQPSDAPETFYRRLANATLQSLAHGPDGRPSGQVDRRDWIGDSGLGAMFNCNLDPDIPDGKGRFNTDVAIRNMIRDQEQKFGVGVDGLSLDCFLGAVTNFRRDHFKYLDSPLSFSATPSGLRPVIPAARGSIEWMKDLKKQPWWKDRILMANLGDDAGGDRLTFAAPYLDVFGVEHAWLPDPDYLRSMARNKPITDLPYSPRAPWVTSYLQVHGIFPGYGHDPERMKKHAPVLRLLMKEGWNPITAARSDNPLFRLERYGRFLVIHNTSDQPQSGKISNETHPDHPKEAIHLDAKQTVVIDGSSGEEYR